ncbi:hypothetical protein NDU88_003575 [Pleurodeles waltl]|uniref:Uncharacterized protein n=1 Tax=Pleurodeles waltl TaxID=8319 RepID=A0AAV7TR00_PLEWA|nr:hypothetical protein NDU88_003575 [Pleurodeles waltl]
MCLHHQSVLPSDSGKLTTPGANVPAQREVGIHCIAIAVIEQELQGQKSSEETGRRAEAEDNDRRPSCGTVEALRTETGVRKHTEVKKAGPASGRQGRQKQGGNPTPGAGETGLDPSYPFCPIARLPESAPHLCSLWEAEKPMEAEASVTLALGRALLTAAGNSLALCGMAVFVGGCSRFV